MSKDAETSLQVIKERHPYGFLFSLTIAGNIPDWSLFQFTSSAVLLIFGAERSLKLLRNSGHCCRLGQAVSINRNPWFLVLIKQLLYPDYLSYFYPTKPSYCLSCLIDFRTSLDRLNPKNTPRLFGFQAMRDGQRLNA